MYNHCDRARKVVLTIASVLGAIGSPLTALSTKAESRRSPSVEGIVVYKGPQPDPIPIAEAGTVRQIIVVDPKTDGLKDAVVWMEPAPASMNPPTSRKEPPLRMIQRDYRFNPHVLAIHWGQTVEFVNEDPANHGISADALENENRFNVTTPVGQNYIHKFISSQRPDHIKCPIHSSMSAWIYVFKHPFHAVTDDAGRFRLPRLPPGRYTIYVRHPDGGLSSRFELEIRPEKPVRLRIVLDKKTPSGKVEFESR